MGSVLRHLGASEGRADYLDRAAIEYTAAIYHYELTGHERFRAINLNNLAMLLYRLGRYREAHEHLDRAVEVFKRLNDPGNVAQVEETLARVLFAEGRYSEAEKIITDLIRVFERGGEQSCLADALAIRATVLARLGHHDRSLALFRRAIATAAEGGCLEKAGHASLALIEEHGEERLSEVELYAAYRRADEFLKNTQDLEDIRRLRVCARIVARKLLGPQIEDPDFSLHEALRAYEARLIEAALKRVGGSVAHAAHLLGFRHHGSLAGIIERRHPELLSKRSPVIRRQRSIVREERATPLSSDLRASAEYRSFAPGPISPRRSSQSCVKTPFRPGEAFNLLITQPPQELLPPNPRRPQTPPQHEGGDGSGYQCVTTTSPPQSGGDSHGANSTYRAPS